MNDAQRHIRLPVGLLPNQLSTVGAPPQDDEQFASRQVELIQQLFGRSDYLRAHGSAMPESDAFLSIFVTLLDVLADNARPEQANQCIRQLRRVLDIVFPLDQPPAPSYN